MNKSLQINKDKLRIANKNPFWLVFINTVINVNKSLIKVLNHQASVVQ